MNVFISSDIEGTCGINHWDETHHDHPDVKYFMKQMTREISAACNGAKTAGANEILIKDGHGGGRNVLPDELPREVRLFRGWSGHPYHMMAGLELGKYDAVLFTGYHSCAGSGNSPLSHTKNGKNEYMLLNGERLSEFRMNAYTAGMLGIPVCFISGDKGICEEAKKLIPNIHTVETQECVGGATIAIHPDEAVELIEKEVREVLSDDYKSCKVPMPEEFDFVIRYREHTLAYQKSFYPGCTLEDSKNVRLKTKNYMDILRFLEFAF